MANPRKFPAPPKSPQGAPALKSTQMEMGEGTPNVDTAAMRKGLGLIKPPLPKKRKL
jgi:hypothetical protein